MYFLLSVFFFFLRVFNFFIFVYMVLILVRIVLSWIAGMDDSKVPNIILKLTNPFVGLFRGIAFLKIDTVDITPVAAMGVLYVVNRFVSVIVSYRRISFGIILTMILRVVWAAISFSLSFLIIILILRIIYILMKQKSNPFWKIIETVSQPVVTKVNGFINKNKTVDPTTSVAITLGVLVGAYLVLSIGFFVVTLVMAWVRIW